MINARLEKPNYTQIPNIYLDEIMYKLSASENLVLIFIMRKTFGWHKEKDVISYSQIEKATGLSRPTVSKALQELVKKCLIKATKKGQSVEYQIVFADDEQEESKENELNKDSNQLNNLTNKESNQLNNLTSTSKNPLLVEPETSKNSLHTKETNIKKIKESNKENVYKELYDTYIQIYESIYARKPEILYPIMSKRITSLLKQGITKDQLLHAIKQAKHNTFTNGKTGYQLNVILSDKVLQGLINEKPKYMQKAPERKAMLCECGGVIKYGFCTVCGKEP